MKLLGPTAFDLTAPAQSARRALAAWAQPDHAVSEPLPSAEGDAPGLYFLVDDDGALVGFWLTFGPSYLEEGPGPGRTPPFARELLEAATEEIWWERLQVAPLRAGRWQPLVVLEWPPALADRSGAPPPGAHRADSGGADDDPLGADEPTGWLTPAVAAGPGFDEPEWVPTALRRWDDLPTRRSLVTLIRGDLGRRSGVHDGRFALAAPPPQPTLVPEGLPLAEWIEGAAASHVPDTPELLEPVRLFGGRAAFPLPGWLARDLEPTPAQPADALTGELVARDIHSRFWAQVALAVSLTLLVLLGVLGFSGGVHLAALPRLDLAAAAPPVEAQPAMSVCSADHRAFVEALRCEVRHLAAGGTPGEADCTGPDPGEDLQAAYCGLRDRAADGWLDPSGHDYAELAAAAACFDVLGRPWPYARDGSDGALPDPDRLLADEQLRVSSLVDLVAELDGACSLYRGKLEVRTSAAILSTHIGDASTEGEALRDVAFTHAAAGTSPSAAACWETGRAEAIDAKQRLLGLCGTDPAEEPLQRRKAWLALSGDATTPVTSRYVDARFGAARTARGLWACHLELTEGPAAGPLAAMWDMPLPRPRRYGAGGVVSQLALDAGLRALRERSIDEVCWTPVDAMIGSYEPVHPLLEPLADGAWPSPEQQLCGQVCAAAYRVARAPDAWVTPGTDLGRCVSRDPTAQLSPDGALDRLGLPWYTTPDGAWTAPDTADVCAFNLLAQERFRGLVDAQPGPLWAGESAAGSGVAGGPEGGAQRAAEALGRYGRNRSSATCSQVASQCFTSELLHVLADGRSESHQWRERWSRRVGELASAQSGAIRSPWCRLIRPYMQEDGRLPEGEFDFPCALGVDRARRQVDEQIARLAAGAFRTDAR